MPIYLRIPNFCCTFVADFDAKEVYMTALQLNADIYRNLAVLSEDQSMLDKAAKYIRRLVKQMTDDPTCMTKEEFFARVDEAKEQANNGEVYRFNDKQQMLEWLNSL